MQQQQQQDLLQEQQPCWLLFTYPFAFACIVIYLFLRQDIVSSTTLEGAL